ncbi:MAG TPA: alpha-L-fucosidase [Candidatus Kryptonia bacterium]
MELKRVSAAIGFMLIFVLSSGAVAQTDTLLEAAIKNRDARLQWWREARFGMFIHWGPVSLVGMEISWSRGGLRRGIEKTGTGEIPVDVYDNLYKRFDPVKFDAKEWVAIAQSAGMKYMVLTAKHCDGFCLWRTKVDNYNIGSTPFKRDVCGELAAAAHQSGMKIGWYYSPMDWRDPDCRTERNSAYVQRMQTHLSELLGNYGRIDLLWFDTEGGPAVWDQPRTYHLVRSLQPGIIINNRLDIPTGDLYDVKTQIGPYADYATPEQQIGLFNNNMPWETCMTLGTQWSWKPGDSLKTSSECIGILIQCVTGDGNLLLDVGPMPDGRIELRQVKILEEIGDWLRKYGESVYDTRGGPFRNGEWGGATFRGKTIYLHIQKWRGERIYLPPLKANILSTSVLTGGKVSIDLRLDSTIVRMPEREHDATDTIIKLELDKPVASLEIKDRSSVPVEGKEY